MPVCPPHGQRMRSQSPRIEGLQAPPFDVLLTLANTRPCGRFGFALPSYYSVCGREGLARENLSSLGVGKYSEGKGCLRKIPVYFIHESLDRRGSIVR